MFGSNSGASEIFIWGNFFLNMTYVQLTTWCSNDENKHDEITFQLAAVDLNSVHLWSKIFVTDIVF